MDQLTTKGAVCFIQSDESPENAADKLKVMARGEFHLLTDWSSFNKLGSQEQEHYDLIVLDSLTTLLGGQTRWPEHERRGVWV